MADQFGGLFNGPGILGWKPFAASGDQGTVGGIAKSAGAGLADAAANVAGLPGDIGAQVNDIGEQGFRALAAKMGATPEQIEQAAQEIRAAIAGTRRFPSSQDVRSGIEQYAGGFYQPQAPSEEMAQRVGRWAPAAVTPGIGRAAAFAGPNGITGLGNIPEYGAQMIDAGTRWTGRKLGLGELERPRR